MDLCVFFRFLCLGNAAYFNAKYQNAFNVKEESKLESMIKIVSSFK